MTTWKKPNLIIFQSDMIRSGAYGTSKGFEIIEYCEGTVAKTYMAVNNGVTFKGEYASSKGASSTALTVVAISGGCS